MLFMVSSRARPGVTRERLIEYFRENSESTKQSWEMRKKGTLTNIHWKLGDEPGFFAIVHLNSLDEAQSIAADSPGVKSGLLELDIEPVSHFPEFE